MSRGADPRQVSSDVGLWMYMNRTERRNQLEPLDYDTINTWRDSAGMAEAPPSPGPPPVSPRNGEQDQTNLYYGGAEQNYSPFLGAEMELERQQTATVHNLPDEVVAYKERSGSSLEPSPTNATATARRSPVNEQFVIMDPAAAVKRRIEQFSGGDYLPGPRPLTYKDGMVADKKTGHLYVPTALDKKLARQQRKERKRWEETGSLHQRITMQNYRDFVNPEEDRALVRMSKRRDMREAVRGGHLVDARDLFFLGPADLKKKSDLAKPGMMQRIQRKSTPEADREENSSTNTGSGNVKRKSFGGGSDNQHTTEDMVAIQTPNEKDQQAKNTNPNLSMYPVYSVRDSQAQQYNVHSGANLWSEANNFTSSLMPQDGDYGYIDDEEEEDYILDSAAQKMNMAADSAVGEDDSDTDFDDEFFAQEEPNSQGGQPASYEVRLQEQMRQQRRMELWEAQRRQEYLNLHNEVHREVFEYENRGPRSYEKQLRQMEEDRFAALQREAQQRNQYAALFQQLDDVEPAQPLPPSYEERLSRLQQDYDKLELKRQQDSSSRITDLNEAMRHHEEKQPDSFEDRLRRQEERDARKRENVLRGRGGGAAGGAGVGTGGGGHENISYPLSETSTGGGGQTGLSSTGSRSRAHRAFDLPSSASPPQLGAATVKNAAPGLAANKQGRPPGSPLRWFEEPHDPIPARPPSLKVPDKLPSNNIVLSPSTELIHDGVVTKKQIQMRNSEQERPSLDDWHPLWRTPTIPLDEDVLNSEENSPFQKPQVYNGGAGGDTAGSSSNTGMNINYNPFEVGLLEPNTESTGNQTYNTVTHTPMPSEPRTIQIAGRMGTTNTPTTSAWTSAETAATSGRSSPGSRTTGMMKQERNSKKLQAVPTAEQLLQMRDDEEVVQDYVQSEDQDFITPHVQQHLHSGKTKRSSLPDSQDHACLRGSSDAYFSEASGGKINKGVASKGAGSKSSARSAGSKSKSGTSSSWVRLNSEQQLNVPESVAHTGDTMNLYSSRTDVKNSRKSSRYSTACCGCGPMD
ncbi:unnamed protein product [Amoebophrya sp. A120]|nr:unnamed protein product [Amoebophrya sp. A120]|eukprot:GSA120T00004895001.1